MDKTGWIVVTLCTLGLVAYFAFYPSPPPAPATAGTESQTAAASGAEAGNGAVPTPPTQAADAAAPEFRAPDVEEETRILRNEVVEYEFSNRGGGIRSARMLRHDNHRSGLVTLNDHGRAPVGALGRIIGDAEEPVYYQVNEELTNGDTIVYEAPSSDGIGIRKTYRLRRGEREADGYIVDLEVTMTNAGETPAHALNYFLYAGSAAPLEPNEWIKPSFCWNAGGSPDHKDVNAFGQSGFLFFKFGEERERLEAGPASMVWAGVYNQFFTTLITPEEPFESRVWARRLDSHPPFEGDGSKPFYAIEAAMGLPDAKLEAGQSLTRKFEIYTGPRSYVKLAEIGLQRDEVMFYGWFTPISQLLMRVMMFLHDKVASFGIAILLLTFMIRIVIWPLHAKSTRTMKRMSLLSPKLTELREKHKDNPQKQQQEMMKLYKEYGINPFGGCLPLFLQIPIFFGFYRMLQSAVELRGEEFLWVKDLSMPDTIANIGGIPLNPLPLLMAVTMIIQMWIGPKTGDKMQQRIFMLMPLFFLAICYNFASALALYWTAQNIFSIGQTYLMNRVPEPTLEKKPKPAGPGAGGGRWDGPGGRQKKPKPKGPRTGGAAGSAAKRKNQ